jgi:hypothetical protein
VGGTCDSHRGGEMCLEHFGWRPEGERPLRRPRHMCKDNIKMDEENGFDGAYWIRLAQDRVQ